jgi:tRNA threonylcarbamoyladenosine biosynthesis protein TsaB
LKILGIETSSPIFSLCLYNDDNLLYEFRKQREFESHRDALIFEEARHLLDSVGEGVIDAIAISIGPGMFTSLRVGLSLAKGIALVHSLPLVAVNTLDVIGVKPSFLVSPVVAVMNAYREEIYAAFYNKGERTGDYLLTTPVKLLQMIDVNTFVICPHCDVFDDSTLDTDNLKIMKDDCYLPSASKVVSLALPRIRRCDFDDIEFLEPYYIKKTDAERKYDKDNAV